MTSSQIQAGTGTESGSSVGVVPGDQRHRVPRQREGRASTVNRFVTRASRRAMRSLANRPTTSTRMCPSGPAAIAPIIVTQSNATRTMPSPHVRPVAEQVPRRHLVHSDADHRQEQRYEESGFNPPQRACDVTQYFHGTNSSVERQRPGESVP